MKLTGPQIAQGRRLLNWSTRDLAEKAELPEALIVRAEVSVGRTILTQAQSDAIRAALEYKGVRFGDPGTGGTVKLDRAYRV